MNERLAVRVNAIALADEVSAWLEHFRATMTESTIEAHSAYCDTDNFVETRVTSDGVHTRTWKEVEPEWRQQVSAKRHAGSVSLQFPELLNPRVRFS